MGRFDQDKVDATFNPPINSIFGFIHVYFAENQPLMTSFMKYLGILNSK